GSLPKQSKTAGAIFHRFMRGPPANGPTGLAMAGRVLTVVLGGLAGKVMGFSLPMATLFIGLAGFLTS
ncbi:hypothetical protein D2U88_00005, partial [Flagellimonas aequoris]